MGAWDMAKRLKLNVRIKGMILLVVLLTPTLSACGVSPVDYENVINERDSIERELVYTKSYLTKITAENDGLIMEKEQLQAESKKIKEELEAIKSELSYTNSQNDRLSSSIEDMNKALTPSPDHAISFSDTQDNPDFMSVTWKDKDYELQQKVISIGKQYNKSHTYIANETDCNDMAVDLWNMLFTQGIRAAIVIGNIDNEYATFEDTNHAWLYVFDDEAKYFILEPTTGEVFFKDSVDKNVLKKYYPGWIYKKPSDLWLDLKKKW
jgi:hypothetical protein